MLMSLEQNWALWPDSLKFQIHSSHHGFESSAQTFFDLQSIGERLCKKPPRGPERMGLKTRWNESREWADWKTNTAKLSKEGAEGRVGNHLKRAHCSSLIWFSFLSPPSWAAFFTQIFSSLCPSGIFDWVYHKHCQLPVWLDLSVDSNSSSWNPSGCHNVRCWSWYYMWQTWSL